MLATSELRVLATQAGFARCGFARIEPIESGPLDAWIAQGFAADMGWLVAKREQRLEIRTLLKSAQTAMVLAVPYGNVTPGPVARYARGRDYHYTLRDRLKRLRKAVWGLRPDLPTYGSVDSNPVMEKVWAERAGLGFMGKHGLIIVPGLGSQVVLAVLFLGEAVDAYDSPRPRQCGDCELCLRACPTQAFPSPGVVDARKCLSYQSIENPGAIPAAIRPAFKLHLFGCDVCQAVCPWNARAVEADPGMAERPLAKLSALEFAALTPEQYAALIPGSPLARAGYDGLRRNAALALGALAEEGARGVLEALLKDPSPVVAEAAGWALGQLRAG